MSKAVPMKDAYGYCRVSTESQRNKGFGILAQKIAIRTVGRLYNYNIRKIFVEIGSGVIVDRPILNKTLRLCERDDATIVVAKADRLSRVAWHGMYLYCTRKMIAAEAPFANKITMYFLFIQAELEWDAIVQRTKASVTAAILKGVKFGTGIKKTHAKLKQAYKDFAQKKKTTIAYYYAQGFTSVKKLKDVLNKNKVKTFRGKTWHNSNVHRLLKELNYL